MCVMVRELLMGQDVEDSVSDAYLTYQCSSRVETFRYQDDGQRDVEPFSPPRGMMDFSPVGRTVLTTELRVESFVRYGTTENCLSLSA
jgi:hypothetical protein